MALTRTLILLTLAARLSVFLLATLCSSLPPFDSSGGYDALLRWDAVHFLHIAESGYVFEHEWAFLYGLPMLLQLPAPLFHLLSIVMDIATTLTLYDLSKEVFRGQDDVAKLATVLSLLPSSPATFRLAPYNEPFFTFLSYRGMLHCQRKQYLAATVYFTLAGLFRSNSILLAGFLLWGMIVDPLLTGSSLDLSAPLYVAPIFLPFLGHNAAAYVRFCNLENTPEWCSRTIPMIYSHIQKAYWNVGLLNYFTVAQIPNFIISAPPIFLIYAFGINYLRRSVSYPFRSRALAPHALHAILLTTVLVFAAHTQIILRLAASMPFVYWAAAWLLIYHPRLGRGWVTWSVVWGGLSIALWATFLPPA